MFRDGELDLEEVFDLEKWAWFFAVVDIGYTYHGTAPRSVKFYYNPTKGKFEPIGYDGHFGCDGGNSYLSIEFPFSNKSWHSGGKLAQVQITLFT